MSGFKPVEESPTNLTVVSDLDGFAVMVIKMKNVHMVTVHMCICAKMCICANVHMVLL